MLSLSAAKRYFLYSRPTDMRKGFAGLSGLVRQHMAHDLMGGDVFIFINGRKDRIKLLMWDVTGFAIYYKQLEKGTFELARKAGRETVELSWAELAMLLEGIGLQAIKRRKRYRKTA